MNDSKTLFNPVFTDLGRMVGQAIYSLCIFFVRYIVINKLFIIDFETNVSDKSFIEEQRFNTFVAYIILYLEK